MKVVLKGEKIDSKIDFDCIAILCEGYTGSDLEPCKKQLIFLLGTYWMRRTKGKNLV